MTATLIASTPSTSKKRARRAKGSTAPIASTPAPEASTLTPEQIASMRRTDELKSARRRYLTCTAGMRQPDGTPAGGGDLVGRALRAQELLNGKDFIRMDEFIELLGKVDNAKLLAWGNTYVSGLVQNKTTARRIKAFSHFLASNGYAALQVALQTFTTYRAWQFSETAVNPKTGTSITYTVDVVREVNDMFALKLTNARRAKMANMSTSATSATIA
jgi:hypothetical protein